jgi:gentisate 1,2-dioxygenase
MDMTSVKEIQDLDAWLNERKLSGHWQRDEGEREVFAPTLWKWEHIYEGLMKANELVPMDQTGRRTIRMRVPSMRGRMSNSIHMSVQCLLPGEIAKAHRHASAAVRFIIKGGEDAYCVVEGERIPIRTGDFLTTPSMTYHDHYNFGKEPVMWLDGLDSELAGRLVGVSLGNEYPGDQQPVTAPDGLSARIMGHARPLWMKTEHPTPPFRYAWEDTLATLQALKDCETEGDPYNGLLLTYTHPTTGGPTLPTFACELQLLSPKLRTKTHRHVSTTIYQVFKGRGTTLVNGESLEWTEGDIFVIPPWSWHSHENRSDGDSFLYSMNDWPALKALGLYREEVKEGE